MLFNKVYAKPSMRGGITFIGLPGIGNTGKIALLTLLKQVPHRKLEDIYSTDFQAKIFIKGGVLYFPKISIYESLDGQFVFVTGDYQPTTPSGQYELSDYIAKKYVSDLRAKYVIAMAAEGLREVKPLRRVKIATTSDELLKLFNFAEEFGNSSITGANGLIPAISGIIYGVPGACLLAETLYNEMADATAAKAIVNSLNKALNLNFSLSPLREVESEIIEFNRLFELDESSEGQRTKIIAE